VDAGFARKVLGKLATEGSVVRLRSDLYFSAEAVAEVREKIVAHLKQHGGMLAQEARDLTGTSRKYIIPMLEYLDAQGITKREGEFRRLRKG
jgi:selenocysteine-specific elongation factor